MENNNQLKAVLPAIDVTLISIEQRIELEKIRAQNLASGLSLVESFANITIKAIMMLNGGAAIAILAFLGNIISTDYSKWIYGIVWALGGYSIGAACSAIVAFLSYLSQSHYNSMTDETDKSADNIRCWAIVFAIIGVGLFVFSSIVVGATIRYY
ncbi:hypothetical protein [Veillonella atypica]|jgi:hypothetical protein|nr:hypothetical protein [Veillonella atypica]